MYQNKSYSWNFESPLKVSTLLVFTELGSAPEGKFLAIWGALAGQYCQVSTSLSPIGWSLSAFELASKYVSSPWPCQPGAVATFSLCGARIGRLKESIWRFWVLWLFTIALLPLAWAPWDVVWMLFSLLVNMSTHPGPPSPLPLTIYAFTELELAARRKVFEDFCRSGRSLLLSYQLAWAPWDEVGVLLSLLLNMSAHPGHRNFFSYKCAPFHVFK